MQAVNTPIQGEPCLLSIDFGTTNTVAGISRGPDRRLLMFDGSPSLPSAIVVAADGVVSVGRDALRLARREPARFEPNPKRRIDDTEVLLGDRAVSVVDLIAPVLRAVRVEARRQLGDAPVDEVRLTHPAGWGPTRQNILLSAARAAGIGERIVMIPEPIAAVAEYTRLPGNARPADTAVAVYDLGGGTLDLAVVGRSGDYWQVLAEDGLADLGGLDFDQAVLDFVGRAASGVDPAAWQRLLRPQDLPSRRAARIIAEDVRAAKETLSRHPHTDVALPEPFDDVHLTRTEFEGLIRPSLMRSAEVLESTLRRAGVAPAQLAGVFLVGGSSRIPLVATSIGERLGVLPASLDQPETAVAFGALLAPVQRGGHRTRRHGDAGTPPTAGREGPPSHPTPAPLSQPPSPAWSSGPVHPAGPTGAGRAGFSPDGSGGQQDLRDGPGPRPRGPRPHKGLIAGGAGLIVLLAATVVLLLVRPWEADTGPADPAAFATEVEAGMRGVSTVSGTISGATGVQARIDEVLTDGRTDAAEISYSVSQAGQQLDVTIRLVDGSAYLGLAGLASLLPDEAGGKQWALLDGGSSNSVISALGTSLAPLLSNAGTDSYVYLLRGATSVTAEGADPVGGLPAERYAVTIDIGQASEAMPDELSSYGNLLSSTSGEAEATYWVDDAHRLVKAEVTMPGSGRTTMTVTEFGGDVQITAPDPSTVYTG